MVPFNSKKNLQIPMTWLVAVLLAVFWIKPASAYLVGADAKTNCLDSAFVPREVLEKHRQLIEGIEENDAALVETVLESKPPLNIAVRECVDSQHFGTDICASFGALDIAVRMGNEPMVRMLLQHGVDVNGCGTDVFEPLVVATDSQRVDIVRTLLENNAAADIRFSVLDIEVGITTLLHHLSDFLPDSGDQDFRRLEIMDLLIRHGAGIDMLDSGGRTPLMISLHRGALEPSILLMSYGADPYLRDYSGKGGMHALAGSPNEKVTSTWMLFNKYLSTGGGEAIRKAARIAAGSSTLKDSLTLLRRSIIENTVAPSLFEVSLDSQSFLKEGAEPVPAEVKTRLWVEGLVDILNVIKHSPEGVQYDEASRINSFHELLNSSDNHGKLATHQAIDIDRVGSINLEKIFRYFPEIAVDHIDNDGFTPLHLAVQKGRADFISVLLNNNADPLVKDSGGRNAFDMGMASVLAAGNESEKGLLKKICFDQGNYQSGFISGYETCYALLEDQALIEVILSSQHASAILRGLSSEHKRGLITQLVRTEDAERLEKMVQLVSVEEIKGDNSVGHFDLFSLNLLSGLNDENIIKILLDWQLPVNHIYYNRQFIWNKASEVYLHPVVSAVLQRKASLLRFYTRRINLYHPYVYNLLAAAVASGEPLLPVYLLNHGVGINFKSELCVSPEEARGRVFCTSLQGLIDKGDLHQDMLFLLDLYGGLWNFHPYKYMESRSQEQLIMDYKLIMAVKSGSVKLVAELLAKGANPNATILYPEHLKAWKEKLGIKILSGDHHWYSSPLLTNALTRESGKINAEISRLLLFYGATLYPMHSIFSFYYPKQYRVGSGSPLPGNCAQSELINDAELVRLIELLNPLKRVANDWNSGPEKLNVQQEIDEISQNMAHQLNLTVNTGAKSPLCLCLSLGEHLENGGGKPYCQKVAEALTEETRSLICSEETF